jgi:murein L,D-transpeptidase YafK
MKKAVMILLVAMIATLTTFSQSKNAKVESQIIAIEKAGWEAWKNKDANWFQTNLSEDFMMINSKGVIDKAQVIKSTPTDCEVKSYSFDSFKVVILNENAAYVIYTATQDAVCNGKTIPAQVRATAIYVKRGGKWLEASYMETAIAK